MMKYWFISLVIVVGIFSSSSHAASYSHISSVKGLTFFADGVRIKLESMKEVESCENQNFYYLPTPDERYNKFVSALLAAKASGEKLSLQLVGCEQVTSYSYPKVTHIYFCDTSYCE
jgi:hypothetical protein